MLKKNALLLLLLLPTAGLFGQLLVARDTITVIENNYVLKMPWGNGLNYANISTIDLDFDGKKDIVAYDRLNQFGTGPFRCYLNRGGAGQTKYIAAPELSYCFPRVSNWAVLIDYNHDGKEDIFCSTSAGIKVYKNTSAGTLSFALEKSLLYSYFLPGVPSSITNLYASSVGVPGIADIDNDGDFDILTFSPLGVFAEYHKNLSKENYGHSDSLVFELADDCWGKFSESSCTVNFNQCGNKPSVGHIPNPDEKTYHAGACLTCLDSDGDGDQDLVLGDIACNTVQYIHNTGSSISSPLMSDSTLLYPNFPAKNSTTQIRINNFPCTYYTDVDNDTKKDLVATPNAFGSENTKSVWFYKNTSATSTVNFQFVKNNFLQDEMIEVGQNSFPVIFDYDNDTKKDLLIGTYGYYQNNSLKAKLTLYRNVGSLAQPAYSLITRDYGNVSAQNLNNAMPTVGDVDGDGDADICIGTSSGQIHWLENTAGSGNPCNFSAFHNNPFTFTTTSAAAAPQLFDLDNDGKLDLLIGMKNGRIAYYKNNSAAPGTPTFTLITSFLGGVDVKGDPNLFGIDGYAAPFFYREAGQLKLLAGSVDGSIFHYTVPNIAANFNLVSNLTNNYNEGGQSVPCFEDINNDNKRDLIIGNAGGGLALFTSNAPMVGVQELSATEVNDQTHLFPNPTNGLLSVHIEKINVKEGQIRVYSLVGESVMHSSLYSNTATINLQHLNPGVYFIKITLLSDRGNCTITKKVIRE